MCRFIAYKGDRILLSDLVTNPSNSLINQSFHARERSEPLNGDGFGLGWYVPEVSVEPCLFTSVTPAWANQNLRRIASKTLSPCIFAHVRAATAGLEVNDLNCHPFQFGQYLWMHNGSIGDFRDIKRISARISDMIFRKTITITGVSIFYTVQNHVHCADTQHGRIKIKTVEKACMEMITLSLVAEQTGIVFAQIVSGRNKKTASQKIFFLKVLVLKKSKTQKPVPRHQELTSYLKSVFVRLSLELQQQYYGRIK